MIEWNKYIRWGKFISTSGLTLPFKWEFDRLNEPENIIESNLILTSILSLAYPYKIVGIHSINPITLEKYCSSIFYPITNCGDGRLDKYDEYVIYDDVITTGKTIQRAIDHYYKFTNLEPRKCICIMDRREEFQSSDMEIISIYKILE